MKKITFAILIIATMLASCTPAATPAATSAPTAQKISLKDGLGRVLELAGPAKKIISLAPSNTEILFAVGAGSQVIGRDEFSDYPADAKKIASIGGSMSKYNFEEIARLQPDVVLAASINTPEQIKALEDLKIKVFVVANPTSMDGLYANLEAVGQVAGRNSEAASLVSALKARVKTVLDAAAKNTTRPKVFYELDATDAAKPWTAGPGSFIDLLIRLAGGENVAAKLKGDYAQISQEELLAANPDIILLGDAAYGVSPQQVSARPGWSFLNAVKNNRVLAFDDNLVSRPGPRLVDGLEALFKAIQ